MQRLYIQLPLFPILISGVIFCSLLVGVYGQSTFQNNILNTSVVTGTGGQIHLVAYSQNSGDLMYITCESETCATNYDVVLIDKTGKIPVPNNTGSTIKENEEDEEFDEGSKLIENSLDSILTSILAASSKNTGSLISVTPTPIPTSITQIPIRNQVPQNNPVQVANSNQMVVTNDSGGSTFSSKPMETTSTSPDGSVLGAENSVEESTKTKVKRSPGAIVVPPSGNSPAQNTVVEKNNNIPIYILLFLFIYSIYFMIITRRKYYLGCELNTFERKIFLGPIGNFLRKIWNLKPIIKVRFLIVKYVLPPLLKLYNTKQVQGLVYLAFALTNKIGLLKRKILKGVMFKKLRDKNYSEDQIENIVKDISIRKVFKNTFMDKISKFTEKKKNINGSNSKNQKFVPDRIEHFPIFTKDSLSAKAITILIIVLLINIKVIFNTPLSTFAQGIGFFKPFTVLQQRGEVVSIYAQTGSTIGYLNQSEVYSSVAIDSQLKTVISYYDIVNGDLKLANCMNSTCTGTITKSTLDSAGQVGIQSSLFLNNNGGLNISYYDSTNKNLKLISCSNTSCTSSKTTQILDSVGDVGMYSSITGDGIGNLYVTYYDSTNQHLKMVVCNNGVCNGATPITLDSSVKVGKYNNVVIGENGVPIISYFDEQNERLKIVTCGDKSCVPSSIKSLLGNQKIEKYSKLRIGHSGHPEIIYLSKDDQRLKLLFCGNFDCSIINGSVNVSSLGEKIFNPGIVSSGSGATIVSYFDGASSSVRLSSYGNQVFGLADTLDVVDSNGVNIETTGMFGVFGTDQSLTLQDSQTGAPISQISTDMTQTRNWGGVSGEIDFTEGKSVVANIVNAPGTANEHILYIPKISSTHNAVYICPNATNLEEVYINCSDGFELNLFKSGLGIEMIDGQEYWVVQNMIGTGGISIISEFDLMTDSSRLQASSPSDYSVSFGTVNGLINSGNTIELQFDPVTQMFNLDNIQVGDIDLEDDNNDLQLCSGDVSCLAAADLWGVEINKITDTITFSPPTGTGYILGGSIITVKVGQNATSQEVGHNQIVNPVVSAEYEIRMLIVNSDGSETGEITVPILDDDTVTISGYLDTVLSFDIDTTTETGGVVGNCDAIGGVDPCDSFDGANDSAGYVVDLGELSTNLVSVSNQTNSIHTNGSTGLINSILFDLETNAKGGAVVTVQSLNGGLRRDTNNIIPSVGILGEVLIEEGSGLYGIKSTLDEYRSDGVVINEDCDGSNGLNYYCGVNTNPREIFNTDGNVLSEGRVQFAVGVSPSSLNSTGTYSDELTFVATATF